ncbi:MAG: SHOCT domain-containing protein [Chromatiaceae bacterium]
MMGGGFGFGIPGLGMVLFWGLIIVAVVLVARSFYGSQERGSQKSAREILDERYARGEIDKQEYEERKQALH